MTIRQMRELLNLSQKTFGEKYHIPMRSIQNWEGGQRECPEYVLHLLERCVWQDYEEEESDDLEEAKLLEVNIRGMLDDGYCPKCNIWLDDLVEECPECHSKLDWTRWKKINEVE